MKEKLTIIIPCYNCEETLEEAVNSIYEQNIDIHFEVIMVDDKSIDNTIDVMKNLSKKYSEIKIFYHDENKGGGATRNTAVKNSNGDIIFCLDADDLLPPETLPRMYRYLEEKRCDGVAFHRSIKFNGRNKDDIDHVDIAPNLEGKISINSFISNVNRYQPLYVNFMYTRKAFDKIEGYPTNHSYDTPGFAWRFVCSGLTAYVCPESEYLHRINFHESYYLKEWNAGRINYNWREIFIENYYVFNRKAWNVIMSFNYQDFTKDILKELAKLGDIFIPEVGSVLSKEHTKLSVKISKPIYVSRKSLKGYFFRIRNRIKNFFS